MDTAATERERALEQRVKELERENALLKSAPPAPPEAPKRKKKGILSDSESDSESEPDGGEAAVPVTQSPRPRKRPKSDPLADEDVFEFPCGDWQRLTPAESDRFVQRLLKERGFGFDLLPHQFLAARRACRTGGRRRSSTAASTRQSPRRRSWRNFIRRSGTLFSQTRWASAKRSRRSPPPSWDVGRADPRGSERLGEGRVELGLS